MITFIAGLIVGIIIGLLIAATRIYFMARGQLRDAGSPVHFDGIRGATDAEMDAINAAIRREWNTPTEDDAWKHL